MNGKKAIPPKPLVAYLSLMLRQSEKFKNSKDNVPSTVYYIDCRDNNIKKRMPMTNNFKHQHLKWELIFLTRLGLKQIERCTRIEIGLVCFFLVLKHFVTM